MWMDKYKTLKIDEKWSVVYDPSDNDRPKAVRRYGQLSPYGPALWNNIHLAMFYRLLELEGGDA